MTNNHETPADRPCDRMEHAARARRLRVTTLRLSAIATLILAAIAYVLVDEAAAAGVLLGGIAGVVGFRMLTARLDRLPTIAPEKLHASMLAGTYVRLAIYAMFLIAGYYLDRAELHGLFGTLAGIMVIRFVPLYTALAAARGTPAED